MFGATHYIYYITINVSAVVICNSHESRFNLFLAINEQHITYNNVFEKRWVTSRAVVRHRHTSRQ